jgi:VanZ family protein
MGVIFAFSAQNGAQSGSLSRWAADMVETITGMDISEHVVRKLAHATVYLILAVLISGFLRALRRWNNVVVIVATVLIAAAYAVTDEWHQTFSAGRAPLATDVLIDTCGAIVGGCASALVVFLRSRIQTSAK